MTDLTFRFAERKDIPLILRFIKELADYEGLLSEVVATEEILETWIFDKEKAEVLLAVDKSGEEIGFALFFHNFSTFLGRAGIYLEDLYVSPVHRGKGYGKAILQKTGCRLLWKEAAEDWNGGVWIPTPLPSGFISPWEQNPCPTGQCTVWQEIL